MLMTPRLKNLISGSGPPFSLLEDLRRVRALDLVAVVPTYDRLAARVRWRAVVADHFDFVAARLGVELHPVHRRNATHEQEFVFLEMEENSVADDVAIVTARHHLLGLVRREVCEAVDGGMRNQLERIAPFDGQLRHVMRLVVQHHRLAPGALLVAPVGELIGHNRVDVGADLRIAQQLDRIAGVLEHAFQALLIHRCCPRIDAQSKRMACRDIASPAATQFGIPS